MSVWMGYPVLPIESDGEEDVSESLVRGVRLFKSVTGLQQADQPTPAPAPVRSFLWKAFGDVEIAALRSFLDERRGRAVPFWLPSYRQDLLLSEDFLVATDLPRIQWAGYAESYFGTTGARRHLALHGPGVPMAFYRVIAATDPGSYLPETLQVAPAAAQTYPVGTIVSFLKLVRLEEDQVEISYPSRGIAVATIRVRELPMEAPA